MSPALWKARRRPRRTAEAAGVREVTIRNRHKGLREALGI
jgi:transcription initiation factor TFIIIB Brf1 subunit/transcription initiation factor TFIIB